MWSTRLVQTTCCPGRVSRADGGRSRQVCLVLFGRGSLSAHSHVALSTALLSSPLARPRISWEQIRHVGRHALPKYLDISSKQYGRYGPQIETKISKRAYNFDLRPPFAMRAMRRLGTPLATISACR